MASPDAVAALIERIYYQGFNNADELTFDESYSPGFMHHSKVIHDVAPGGEGEKQSMVRFRAAIPDIRFEIVDMVINGDRVAVRLRAAGHATAPFGTVPAGPYNIHAVAWFRTVDAAVPGGVQVAEEWFFTDAFN